MKKDKRVSVRTIVFFRDSIALMHRLKTQDDYYIFPGGGIEEGESFEECAVREVFEEFGIITKPIKKIYTYEDDERIQHYVLSHYVSGTFGTGDGEEFFVDNGFFVPGVHNLEIIKGLRLFPEKIKQTLIKDFDVLKNLKKEDTFEIKNFTEK